MEVRRSESISELVKALALASMQFKPVIKNKENPFYHTRYADLAGLIDATREALAKQGLVIIQIPRVLNNRAVEITTMLAHSSGEFLAHELMMPSAQGERFDAQTIGAGITYGRRYGYQSVLNLAGEEDDDGNSLVETKPAAQSKPNGNGHSRPPVRSSEDTEASPSDPLAPFQVKGFMDACKKSGKNNSQIMEYLGSLGCEELAEMQRKQFPEAIKWAMGVQ